MCFAQLCINFSAQPNICRITLFNNTQHVKYHVWVTSYHCKELLLCSTVPLMLLCSGQKVGMYPHHRTYTMTQLVGAFSRDSTIPAARSNPDTGGSGLRGRLFVPTAGHRPALETS